jgi:hypothetical protein
MRKRGLPAGFAQAAASGSFGTAWVLILLSATLAMFGTLALYGHLAGGRADGMMGIAIWRSGTLPRWTALLFAVHTPLLAFASAFSYPLELLGGITLLGSALWLAPHLCRAAARQGTAAPAVTA